MVFVVFWLVGNHSFGGQQEAGNRSCVGQGCDRYFSRVDDAGFVEVFVGFGEGVEAFAVLAFFHALEDNSWLNAGVERDLT